MNAKLNLEISVSLFISQAILYSSKFLIRKRFYFLDEELGVNIEESSRSPSQHEDGSVTPCSPGTTEETPVVK